ncbi:MAG TPA: hypothetical protein VD994_06400 [Prosthecobacter sp.]|nr:hypothetical protein [Prosthecobacter sp.]
MKTIVAILSGLLILFGASSLATAAPDQPHMRAAIELLQAAKQANKPLPMLNAAKKHIQKAAPNKKGERVDALAAVNEAIASATTGDKEKMEQKVNHAIAQLHSGMAKAK